MLTSTLTGFPGFIAEHVLRESLHDSLLGKNVHWNLIVLPHQRTAAETRAKELGLLSYAIFEGDIELPHLGLKAEELKQIRESTNLLFHLAAIYDLSAGLTRSRSVNVNGTKNVFEFAISCPHLTKVNYVSTCFVAGRRQGLIRESELSDRSGFHNHYERTKFEAEAFVQSREWPFRVAIFRPSIVVGHSITGETSKFDGPLVVVRFLRQWRWLLRHLLAFPNLGFKDSWVNTIPVDIVARTLWLGGSDPEVTGVLHVATPDVPSTEAFFPYLIWNTLKLKNFYPSAWLSRIILRVLGVFPFPLLTGLPAEVIDYFFYRGQFDTSEFERLAAKKGILIPSYESYYGRLIEFAKKNRRPCPHERLFLWQRVFGAFGLLICSLLFAAGRGWVSMPSEVVDVNPIAGAVFVTCGLLSLWGLIQAKSRMFHRWAYLVFILMDVVSIFFVSFAAGLLIAVSCILQGLLSLRIRETFLI